MDEYQDIRMTLDKEMSQRVRPSDEEWRAMNNCLNVVPPSRTVNEYLDVQRTLDKEMQQNVRLSDQEWATMNSNMNIQWHRGIYH